MTGQNITCPVCRSILQPEGDIDFNAPSICHPICPVCTYPEWVPSVQDPSQIVPVPVWWKSLNIIWQNPNPTTLYRASTIVNVSTGASTPIADTPKPADSQSVYKDFNVATALGDSANYAAKSIGTAIGSITQGTFTGLGQGLFSGLGLPLVAVGVIIMVLLLRKK